MRKTPLKRGKPLSRRTRVRPKKRKPSEFARIYGSKERVLWVKAQPCVAAGFHSPCDGRIENAHIVTDGMGRKASYEAIVPLCRCHHRRLHDMGRERFENWSGVVLASEARRLETRWQAHLSASTDDGSASRILGGLA